MPLNIICPKCSTSAQLPDHAAGKTLRCRKCGTTFEAAIEILPDRLNADPELTDPRPAPLAKGNKRASGHLAIVPNRGGNTTKSRHPVRGSIAARRPRRIGASSSKSNNAFFGVAIAVVGLLAVFFLFGGRSSSPTPNEKAAIDAKEDQPTANMPSKRVSPTRAKHQEPAKTTRVDTNAKADPEMEAFLAAKQESLTAEGLEAKLGPWLKYLKTYNQTGKHSREAHGHVRLIFLAQGWTNAEQKLKDAYILPMRDGQGAAFPGIKTLDDISRLIAANPAVEDQVYLRLLEAELALRDLNERGYTRELEAQCRTALSKAKTGCSTLENRYAVRDYVRQAFAVYNSTFATFLEMRLRAWVALRHDDFNVIDNGLLQTQLELLGTMIKTIDEMRTSPRDEEWERFKRPFLEGMIEIYQSIELICRRGS